MTEESTASVSKNSMNRIMFGFSRSLFIWMLFLLFPRFITEFFILGLQNASLIIVIIALGLILFLQALNRLPKEKRKFVSTISTFISGGVTMFLGLIFQFHLDDNSIPSIILISIVLVAGYLAIFLDFALYFPYENHSNREHRQDVGGAIIGLVILGIPLIIYPSDPIFYFLTGVMIVCIPLCDKNTPLPIIKDYPLFLRGDRIRHGVHIFFTSLLLFVSIAFIYHSVVREDYPIYGWIILGIAAGILLWGFIPSSIIKNSISVGVGGLGLFGLYLWFALDQLCVANFFWGFSIGVITGILIADSITAFRTYPANKSIQVSTQFFFFMVIIVIAGIMATQIRWVVRDYNTMIPWGFAIIGGIVIFALGHELFRLGLRSDIQVAFLKIQFLEMPKKLRKLIPIVSLVCLIIIPLFMGILYYRFCRVSVTVNLPQTMYTVDGTAVNQVTLDAKTAKILFYSDPKVLRDQATGPEAIRPGRSIRIGAYFYGTQQDSDKITTAEAVDFLGNNIDVVAVGGWLGWFLNKTHIESMKITNPALKFYAMAFATTYWEDPKNNITATGGQLTVPWSWGIAWNDTMHEWTLKLKNGTEAYGVRHGPNSPYDHLMDMGNMQWADFFAWFFDQRVAEFGVDGMAVDEVMWNGYWGTDEKELRDYSTVEEIKATAYKWLARVDQGMKCEFITQAFWDEAQQYQQGCWGELAFRCGGAYGDRVDDRNGSIFYESMNWMQIVENIEKLGNASKPYIWAAWYERNNTEALEYAIATYLMGKPNGSTRIAFHPQPVYEGGYPKNLAGYYMRTVKEEIENHPEYFDMHIGDALGSMRLVQGVNGEVWQRDFEHGIVLVNPYHARVPGFGSNDPIWNPSH